MFADLGFATSQSADQERRKSELVLWGCSNACDHLERSLDCLGSLAQGNWGPVLRRLLSTSHLYRMLVLDIA